MRLSFSNNYTETVSRHKTTPLWIASVLFSSSLLISAPASANSVPVSSTKLLNESEQIISPRTEIPGGDNDTITLGTAYHSKKKGFYGLQSVNGSTDETYGNTRAEVHIGVDLGYKEILNMVNGNVEASLDIPAVEVSAGASYAKETAADEYTGSYTIYVSVKPKKRALVPETNTGYQPTAAALELVEAYPGDKFEQVGDEFVRAIEYGSYLIVNLKIEYKNAKDKRDIGGHLGVDWIGKVKVEGELKLLDEEVKKSVKITVSAIQAGGNVNELTQIIPDGLMSCSLNNPDPCFDLFEDAVVYLKTNYINQFTSLDKYNAVKIYTSRYDESGAGLMSLVPEDYNEISFASKLARKNMSERWIEALLDQRRAENVLTYYYAQLTDEQRSQIEQIVTDARFNSYLFADSVSFCDRNPFGNFCFDEKQRAEQLVRPYDRSVLNLTAQ